MQKPSYSVCVAVQLRERARLLMESVGYVHYGSGMPGRALDFDGVLELKQAWPIQVRPAQIMI